jgi:hypothetical protein
MPISLPNLDDMTYNDLVAEAVALIPGLTDAWTDFNPTDPGIVLVEMFAWLTEMLIFRANQVTDRQRLAFLKLLNGPDFAASLIGQEELTPGLDHGIRSVLQGLLYPESLLPGSPRPPETPDPDHVDAGVRATIIAIRRTERVVTPEDYEARVRANFTLQVARVKAVPRRDLETGGNGAQANDQSDHVSVVVVPHHFVLDAMLAGLRIRGLGDLADKLETIKSNSALSRSELLDRVSQILDEPIQAARYGPTILRLASDPTQLPAVQLTDLLKKIRDDLDPWRVLTTRLHVIGPRYREIRPLVTVARRTDVDEDTVAKSVANALIDFLHPVFGGPDSQGWPVGGEVLLSDLYQRLSAVPGVEYIPEITFEGACGLSHGSFRWNAAGDLLGIRLDSDELPRLPEALADPSHVTRFIAVAGPFDPRRVAVPGGSSTTTAKTSTFRPPDRVGFVPLRLKAAVSPLLSDALRTPILTAIKCRLGDLFRPVGPTNVGHQRLDGTRPWKIVPLTVERSRDNLAVTVISLEDECRELENDLNDLRFALLPLEEARGVGRIRLTFISCDRDSPWFDRTDGSLHSQNDEMVELELTVKQAAS